MSTSTITPQARERIVAARAYRPSYSLIEYLYARFTDPNGAGFLLVVILALWCPPAAFLFVWFLLRHERILGFPPNRRLRIIFWGAIIYSILALAGTAAFIAWVATF